MTVPGTSTVLGERYRLTARIAGGGMGEVWRAEDTVLGREVAIKILRPQYAEDATFLERFRAEARHTAGLSHPHIAAVHDFGEGAGPPYLVMEHVTGEPLSALLAREGALTPERTLHLVGQAALGLQAAHDAGVIHRDVKPGNILVTAEDHVKISDFGIARAANAVPLTQTGAIMGTAYYISPEQASGRPVTPASDIYSLGVVAYQCLTGRLPFPGDTPVNVALAQVSEPPPALPVTVPAVVRSLVMSMLAKDPAARPPSAGALGQDAVALREMLGADSPATTVLPVAAGASGSPGPAAQDGPDTDPGARPGEVRSTDTGPDTDPGFLLPPERRPVLAGRRALPALAAAVVVVLLGWWLASTFGDPADPTPATAGASSAGAADVRVVASDLRGRPLAEARNALTDLGLLVRVARTPGGGAVGTVKDLSPVGGVPAGATITLDVVARPGTGGQTGTGQTGEGAGKGEAGKTKPGKGNGRGKG